MYAIEISIMELQHAEMFQKIALLIDQNDHFKKDLVDSLNANVDLPFINENTEQYIISSLLNTITSVLVKSANEAVEKAKKH